MTLAWEKATNKDLVDDIGYFEKDLRAAIYNELLRPTCQIIEYNVVLSDCWVEHIIRVKRPEKENL